MLSVIAFALGPLGCPSASNEAQSSEAQSSEAQPLDEPAQPAVPDDSESAGPSAREPGPQPQTKDPQPKTAPQQLTADVAQSKVRFLVTRAVGGHIGHFEHFSAKLELTNGQPSKLEIAVKTGSVVADRQGLTSHLKSPDFFNADQFPTATFTTESITPMPGDEPNRYEVTGTMALHGVRGKLVFPATISVEPERVLGSATLDISAKAFGIDYAGMEAELADDAVGLNIELVFPR
jgi:polyisoprenoid-binding protein YceI